MLFGKEKTYLGKLKLVGRFIFNEKPLGFDSKKTSLKFVLGFGFHTGILFGVWFFRRKFDFEKIRTKFSPVLTNPKLLLVLVGAWGTGNWELNWSRNAGNLPRTTHRHGEGKGTRGLFTDQRIVMWMLERDACDWSIPCRAFLTIHSIHCDTVVSPSMTHEESSKNLLLHSTTRVPFRQNLILAPDCRFPSPTSVDPHGLWILCLNPALVRFSAGRILFRSSWLQAVAGVAVGVAVAIAAGSSCFVSRAVLLREFYSSAHRLRNNPSFVPVLLRRQYTIL